MKIAAAYLLALTALVSLVAPVRSHQNVLGIHGSGTTNPSKCYWSIMEDIMAQSKHPTRLSYRAVGSTTGQIEFKNSFQSVPLMDFGSGDIPLSSEDYNQFTAAGIQVAHFPVLLGAVSFFHSVPGAPEIKMTSCVLARIFDRDITQWDDPAIRALNPDLTYSGEISVVHRVKGSSSTASITEYFVKACDDYEFPEFGDEITWKSDTIGCQGSAGVTACIVENEGAIGYIDAGHGIDAGLPEISLRNLNDKYLTSQEASDLGGIAAAETGVLPDKITDNFGEVSLLNRPGDNTWPIVLMTYVYVRQDLTFIEDPQEQALLKAFLTALYDDDYVGECVTKYGFTLPSAAVRTKFSNQVNDLTTSDTQSFLFEKGTQAETATDELVISQKRQVTADLERAALLEDVAELKALVAEMQSGGLSFDTFTEDDEQKLKAALVLSSLSFAFCFLICCFFGARSVGKA